MEANSAKLRCLLPYGAVTLIAKKLGISTPAVSKALKRGNAGNPVVREALRMAQESGAFEAAKTLATLAA